MIKQEVNNSFIYKGWYSKEENNSNNYDIYNLSVEYYDMIRWGYGKIFTPSNIDDMMLPHQRISFYCINKKGYLKIFTMTIAFVDNLSLNELLQKIEKLCKEFNLTFVALSSKKYSWLEITKFLGNDLNFELNEKGEIILLI